MENRSNVMRALIVDDEPLSRTRLRQLLRVEADVEIVGECKNGTEAIAAIREQTPDVVFLDIHVGLDDGLELLDEIEALDLPTRVVLLSGTAEVGPELRKRVSDVVGKPFELKRLASAVLGSLVR